MITGGFPFPHVRVCREPATGTVCPQLATIYSTIDLNPLNQLPNPFDGDANGNYTYCASTANTYHEQITGTGMIQQDIPNISLPGGGSFSGNATSLQGRPVASTAPTDLQCLTWVAANSDWEPRACSSSGGNVVAVTLTAGALPVATGPAAIADSHFFDTGTNGSYTGVNGLTALLTSKCNAGALGTAICGNITDDLANNLFTCQKNGTCTFGSGNGGQLITGAFISGLCVVSFSATPSFDLGSCNTFKMTLQNDVTSSTLANMPSSTFAEKVTFEICQDATGHRNFVWPATVYGGAQLGLLGPSRCLKQTFETDGTAATPIGVPVLFNGAGTEARPTEDWSAGVNVKRFGAKGDLQSASDASATAGSPAITFGSSHSFGQDDVGKIAILDQSTTSRPVLPDICYATNAANGSCNNAGIPVALNGHCAGSVSGTIDTTAVARQLYYTFTEVTAAGDSTHRSFEGWMNIPGALTGACVKINAPAVVNSATSWKVYASLETGNPWVALTVFALNALIVDSNGNVEKVTTNGSSGASVPVWSTIEGGTTTDASVVWTNQGHFVPGTASGQETLQSGANCNNPAIASICELDAISTGGAVPPAPSFLLTTIATVTDTTHITLAANATVTVANVFFHWGTDDRVAITNAKNAVDASVGGELVFPPGSYYVSSPGLTANVPYLKFRGLGHSGSKNLSAGNPTPAGSAELVTAENIVILTYGVSGSNINSGFKWEDMGCRDLTQGIAVGCAHMFGSGHSVFRDMGCVGFWSGYCITFDGGGTNVQSQFNWIQNPNFVGVKDGIVFTNGKSSENTILGSGSITSAQMGGGTGIRWDADGGATSAGGGERISNIQLLYFPRGVFVSDRNTVDLYGVRTENSGSQQTSISGGADENGVNFGTGLILDGTGGHAFCTSNEITGGSFNFMSVAAVLQNICTKTSYYGTSVSTSDAGFVDRSTLSASLLASNGLSISDASGNPVATVSNTTGAAVFQSVRSTGGNFTAPSNVDAVLGATDVSTGSVAGGVTLRAGNWTATGAVTSDPIQINCGTSATTDPASPACPISIGAGAALAWTTTGPQNGNFSEFKWYGTPAVNVSGNVVCLSATVDFKLANCPAGSTSAIGINSATSGNVTKVQFVGEATVNFDAGGPYSPFPNWFACMSAGTDGKVKAQVGACAAGLQVGIFVKAGVAATSGLIWIQFK